MIMMLYSNQKHKLLKICVQLAVGKEIKTKSASIHKLWLDGELESKYMDYCSIVVQIKLI